MINYEEIDAIIDKIDWESFPGQKIAVAMRADKDTYRRLMAVAAAERRKVGSVLAMSVEDQLPVYEKKHDIVPGQASEKRPKATPKRAVKKRAKA